MTEQEQRIYDAMSERERQCIDSLSEGSRPGALLTWARMNENRGKRQPPPGYVPWDKRPASRALVDREPRDDDSERRFP